MRVITCMGGAWKISDAKLAKLLRDIIAGKDFDPDDYGKMIDGNVIDITDMNAEEASWLLAGLTAK